MSYFYAGANDSDPPSYFSANSPLCAAVCVNSNELCLAGQQGVTKTLLTAVLLGVNEQYVRSFDALNDKESCSL